jgi:hypothetical protein
MRKSSSKTTASACPLIDAKSNISMSGETGLFLPANFESFLKRLTDSLFENFRYRGTSKNDSLHMFVPDLVVEPSREQRDIDAATACLYDSFWRVMRSSGLDDARNDPVGWSVRIALEAQSSSTFRYFRSLVSK